MLKSSKLFIEIGFRLQVRCLESHMSFYFQHSDKAMEEDSPFRLVSLLEIK